MSRVKASLAAASSAAAKASAPVAHHSSTGPQPARTAHLAAKHGHQPQQLLQESSQQQQQQQLSLDVLEDQDVPDVGRFTAYADGRVRVLFADRTILSLDTDRAQAKLIMPDGSKQEVPVSRPLGVEEYVQVGYMHGCVRLKGLAGCCMSWLCGCSAWCVGVVAHFVANSAQGVMLCRHHSARSSSETKVRPAAGTFTHKSDD